MLFRLKYVIAVVVVVAAGAAVFLMPHSATSKTKDNKTVVATVDGKEIYRKDVMQVMDSLPIQGQVKPEAVYPMIIDQLINERLIESKASSAVSADDPKVKERLANAREQIVRAVYLENKIDELVSEEAIKAEYKNFKKENEGKMETHARHILLKTEDEAKEVIKKLEDGGAFAALAKEHSIGPTAANGGDLGYFTKEEMLPAFSEVAFATKVGKYTSKPVQTKFGWHVIFVEDRKEKEVAPLAEMEGAIKNRLSQKALETLLKDLRETATIERFSLDGQPLN